LTPRVEEDRARSHRAGRDAECRHRGRLQSSLTRRVGLPFVRIALLSPPWIPVPPSGYGGIEWVVWAPAQGLVARGHDVTLFATGDSKTTGDLRYVFDVGPVAQMHQALPYSMHTGAAYQYIYEEARAGRPYDVVHDHTAWLSLAFAPLIPTPVV